MKRRLPATRATRGITVDTGWLIALEGRKANALALLRATREARARIILPAIVVAEWWRGEHPSILEIGTLEPMTPELAKRAGQLLALARRDNTNDAIVIVSAAQRGDLVITSDPEDLRALAAHVAGVDVARI